MGQPLRPSSSLTWAKLNGTRPYFASMFRDSKL